MNNSYNGNYAQISDILPIKLLDNGVTLGITLKNDASSENDEK